MLILISISNKFVEVLGLILEVEPWTFGTDVKAAHWVARPAVKLSVVMVVWIAV